MRQIIPSFANGFYSPWRATGEALYPNLWRGCVGAWNPAIGPTGLTLFDLSGYGNHGALSGATTPTWSVDSYGHALNYGGNPAHVDCGDVTFFDGLTTFAFSIWLKPSAFSGVNGIWSKFSANNGPVAFLVSGNLYWQIGSTGGRLVSGSLTVNKWDHMVFMVENSTMTMWKNGQQLTGTATLNSNTDHATTLKIGSNNEGNTGWWQGKMTGAIAYRRALTPNEIALLASDPHAPYRVKPRRRAVVAAAPPAGVAPTSHLYGPLVGPLGGPV